VIDARMGPIRPPRVIVVMGVTGSGKTTVGRAFAGAHGWAFEDADDLHPASNIAKMVRGEPLTDGDRAPWLAAVRRSVVHFNGPAGPGIIACSALKDSYRRTILGDDPETVLVYLHGSHELIERRIESRVEHFMPPSLLSSQFGDLEAPSEAIVIDIDQSVAAIVNEIAERTGLSEGTRHGGS